MTHKKIYLTFEKLVPAYATNVMEWFPCGQNAIRVRLDRKQEFVFTYHDNRDWIFETVDSYMKKMKGKKRCD